MKRILTKVLGEHKLQFEDLATILTDVEAILNSRPIATFDSHQEDGSTALTPGHFLVGRPLYSALRSKSSEGNLPGLRRWNLVKRLTAELQERWIKECLRQFHVCPKWNRAVTNLQIGDLVGVIESTLGQHRLPIARVIKLILDQTDLFGLSMYMMEKLLCVVPSRN